MIFSLFKPDEVHEAASDLYNDIVEQARKPVFYLALEVPDTKEGRFDLITLHMFLVLRRLKTEPDTSGRFAQKLFNVMFRNMDHSLREMGAGDLTVGKKVRVLAEAFYGRVSVYGAALDSDDQEALLKALGRNIYDDEAYDRVVLRRLAEYISHTESDLSSQSVDRLMLGIVRFPELQSADA
ncbi:ubiquinol-cytochrome C chaperone family protein [Parvularcula sp. IMCC14364]|uniref:ubiquinol-cytochrome C chaperone family protein n=1 Tax=Parvularcula sp. IMCC14364 TaxID=3067902 RepID=UPI00274169C1|nr:ubiquinol-cytochrome C chaperone family protein [Parvularcula sp. IMCC14364]